MVTSQWASKGEGNDRVPGPQYKSGVLPPAVHGSERLDVSPFFSWSRRGPL